MKKIFLLACCFINLLANAQSPPDLHCVSVLPNGDIQLVWSVPAQSTGFLNYGIWRDGVLIDSIQNSPSTSYLDVGINGNIQRHCYFIVANFSNGQSYISDTLCSIYLTVTSLPIDGCGLNWTPLPLSSGSGLYQINKQDSGSTFLQIASTPALFFNDSVITGPGIANYYISVPDNSGCTSLSNISLGCNATGINSLTANATASIYPNPISNTLTIDAKSNQPASIIVYDIASRKVLEQEFINTISINTTSLAKGIYLYEIKDKTGVIKQGKVVKE